MWTIGISSPVVINMLVFAGNPEFITLPQYYSYNISNMKDEIKKPNSIEAQEKNKGLRLYEKKTKT